MVIRKEWTDQSLRIARCNSRPECREETHTTTERTWVRETGKVQTVLWYIATRADRVSIGWVFDPHG